MVNVVVFRAVARVTLTTSGVMLLFVDENLPMLAWKSDDMGSCVWVLTDDLVHGNRRDKREGRRDRNWTCHHSRNHGDRVRRMGLRHGKNILMILTRETRETRVQRLEDCRPVMLLRRGAHGVGNGRLSRPAGCSD